MSSFVIIRALNGHKSPQGAGIDDLFTEGYNKKTLKVLQKYGNDTVRSMVLLRSPLPAAMEDGINAVSSGQWVELKHRFGYDTFFHLALLINSEVLVEKNAYGINVAPYVPYESESLKVDVDLDAPSLINLLDKTETYLKGNYFAYSPFRNNCQNFIYSLLGANNLLTEEASAFVYQPLDELIKELPSYVEPVVDVAAQLYGIQTLATDANGTGRGTGDDDDDLGLAINDYYGTIPSESGFPIQTSSSGLVSKNVYMSVLNYQSNVNNCRQKCRFEIEKFLYTQPARKKELWRGQAPKDNIIRDIDFFSCTEDVKVARDDGFSGDDCCVFHLYVNAPMISVNDILEDESLFPEQEEYLVLGYGDFFKDEAKTQKGFVESEIDGKTYLTAYYESFVQH